MEHNLQVNGLLPVAPASALAGADTKTILRQTIAKSFAAPGADSIIALVNALIDLALHLKASDIHIDPHDAGIIVRLRIDGALQTETTLPKRIHQEIISRVKILAGLRTDEHQSPQDGRFRIATDTGPVDVRVSIVPTYYGENAVLRLLQNTNEAFDLGALGFSTANQAKILRAIHAPYGMILATGPTGSGKTTTLYTLLQLLNAKDNCIITIEDPIEYAIAGIRQIGVNARAGLTFANGLRSMLRQDPNIIMVGEIRDQETAGLAVNTALTGHLVLTTLHTNDAAATLPRLVDLKIEPYLIASTVNIAIAQRLVRKICQHCKTQIAISDAQTHDLAQVLGSKILEGNVVLYKGKGCELCNQTGYRGRICINEVLVMDNAMREAIHQKGTSAHIKEVAKSQQMQSLAEDGFSKALAGITTIEEVLRTLHE